MAISPEIDTSPSQSRIVKRHRRFTVSDSGEVTIRGFEVPKLASFLLRPDQLPEQNLAVTRSIPTSIAKSATYPELTFPVSRIELCD